MITKTAVSVTTAATLLSSASSTKSIVVSNTSATATLYVGESTVTTTNGFELLPFETYGFELRPGQSLYGVAGSTINALVLDVEEPGTAPAPSRIDLSALGGAVGATVSTTVTGLGTGTDGKLGLIRVGTYPDAEYVEVLYDNANSHWVSKAQPLVWNSDLQYMGTNTTAYTYIQTDATGVASALIGMAVSPVRHAAELFTAGLKLQASMTAFMKGSSTPATYTVQAKFFQNDTADVVVFSSDGSTAVGEVQGALISGSGNTNILYKASGWANVVQNGTTTALGASDVTKAYLWPRIYGKVASGTAYGSVIDLDVQVRWVG